MPGDSEIVPLSDGAQGKTNLLGTIKPTTGDTTLR